MPTNNNKTLVNQTVSTLKLPQTGNNSPSLLAVMLTANLDQVRYECSNLL